METAGIFQTADGTESMLWKLTWDKIDTFLPKLRNEVFKPFEPGMSYMILHSSVICVISDINKYRKFVNLNKHDC